jgi:U6 snRNA-associated Sm-like protein LSm7
MSERGNFRGRGNRGGRGGESRGGRGGGRGGGAAGSDPKDKPKKENIIDLNRFLDKQLKVKFNGGREGMLRLDIPVLGNMPC